MPNGKSPRRNGEKMISEYFNTKHGKVRAKRTQNNASYSYYLGRNFIGVNNPDRYEFGATQEEAEYLAESFNK